MALHTKFIISLACPMKQKEGTEHVMKAEETDRFVLISRPKKLQMHTEQGQQRIFHIYSGS